MKLYFMKQSALDYLKANMDKLYIKYFQFDTPEWIYDEFDYDPFEVFAEVDDFELASVDDMKPGEADFENCKILYTHLKGISDSQASDERLWAGLCNKNFYSYLRTRWQYARRHLKKTADDASAITMRFYYRTSSRSGMFRNALARCWWTGRLTYTNKYANHWELLDAIGSEDLISKISDIFYSNAYSSNAAIVEGFCEGLKFFRDHNRHIANREHIRPTAQFLNALGGSTLLDMFSADEIKKAVIANIAQLLKGESDNLFDDAQTELLDEDDIIDDMAEDVNVDYEEYLDSLVPVTDIDVSSVLGDPKEAEYGCTIYLSKYPIGNKNSASAKIFSSAIPLGGNGILNMQKYFLQKSVGATWNYMGYTYELVKIER